MVQTLFGTWQNNQITLDTRQKIIRAARRVIEGDWGGRPLTVEQIVKASLAAAGVTGSLGTMVVQKLTSDIGYMYTQWKKDNPTEAEEKVRKRLRTGDDDVREIEVDHMGETSLVNRPSGAQVEQAPENRLTQVNLPRDPRGGKKRLRGMDIAMDEAPDGEPEAMRLGATATGGNNPVSKETPITPAPSISYGLPETHTTIIPWNFWVSMVDTGAFSSTLVPQKLSFRLNAIDDIVTNSLTTVAEGATWTAGVHNVPHNNSNTRGSGSSASVFPRTITAGASTTERPFWSNYWKQIYEYYTVLGCEYKITIYNSSVASAFNAELLILHDTDSYSNTEGATGNKTPDTIVAELLSYKHMNKLKVGNPPGNANFVNSNPVEVIYGRHKPGQTHRNISNDGDVKTWTKTNGDLPTLKELFNLRMCRHPMSWGGNNMIYACNVQVELKYIVQFKDLKLNARYPNTLSGVGGTPTIVQTLEDDTMDTV